MDEAKTLDLINEYDNAYYNGTPLVSDLEYDKIKGSLKNISKVGHPPVSNWPKVELAMFMGSQNKAKNLDEFTDWTVKFTGNAFVIQEKIDGFSMELVYLGGKLTRASTRGDGVIGENIIENAMMFQDLPKTIQIENELKVRVEGYISKSDYDSLSGEYKTARNAASGISRRYDGSQCNKISVFAIDIDDEDFKKNFKEKLSELGKIQALKSVGFKTPGFYVGNRSEVESLYREYIGGKRDNLNYDIDGLVIKINDLHTQYDLGIENERPVGQIALKFDAAFGQTIVNFIRPQIGRTGLLVPVADHDPVDILGATHTTTGLHNYGYVVEKRIVPGCEVVIEKRGDIIPKCSEVLSGSGDPQIPQHCPDCGSNLHFDGVNLWCQNKECSGRKLNYVLHWFDTIGMKGFSESFFKTLISLGAKEIHQIYAVDKDMIEDRFGKKTADNFFKELNRTMTMSEATFIAALGVSGLGMSKSEVIVNRFGFEKVFDLTPQELSGVYGFAETSAESICRGLSESKDVAKRLMAEIVVKSFDGALSGKTFCVTGSLKTMERKDFKQLVIENGGTFKTGVSMGLDYLVTNTPNSGSSKNQKAQKYGTKLITEDEFLGLIR